MNLLGYQGKKNISGKRIRELRSQQKLSQTALAAKLQLYGVQMDQRALSRVEIEKRVVAEYELWALSMALGVDMIELLQPDIVAQFQEGSAGEGK